VEEPEPRGEEVRERPALVRSGRVRGLERVPQHAGAVPQVLGEPSVIEAQSRVSPEGLGLDVPIWSQKLNRDAVQHCERATQRHPGFEQQAL